MVWFLAIRDMSSTYYIFLLYEGHYLCVLIGGTSSENSGVTGPAQVRFSYTCLQCEYSHLVFLKNWAWPVEVFSKIIARGYLSLICALSHLIVLTFWT